MAREVTNQDDVIDSRDVIERIDELTALHDDYTSAVEGAEWSDDDQRVLTTLESFARECENDVEDWMYGATLIRYSYFTEYAKQLAQDIVTSEEARNMSEQWPYRHIDWEAAADELHADYNEYTFDGVIYYAR